MKNFSIIRVLLLMGLLTFVSYFSFVLGDAEGSRRMTSIFGPALYQCVGVVIHEKG